MLKFEPILKDKLFYNKFTYCIGFYLQEVSCLRPLEHYEIDAILRYRKENRQKIRQAWAKSLWHVSTPEITTELAQNLHNLLELVSKNDSCKLVVAHNHTGHIYSNDLNFIKTIDELDYLKDKRFSQAIIDRPPDVVRVRNSIHNTRCYLRAGPHSDEEAVQIKNFLKLHSSEVRLSPALESWINTPYNRTMDHFFIDYSDSSYLTLIKLKFPSLIRKTHIIVSE